MARENIGNSHRDNPINSQKASHLKEIVSACRRAFKFRRVRHF